MKLNKQNNNLAAIDVGGTNTRFALFDDQGKISLKEKTATDYHNSLNTLNWMVDLLNKFNINKLALCIPGPSDYINGIVLKSPNLGATWDNLDVKKYLLDHTNVQEIIFENDANAMAYANHKINHLTKDQISQFFTISTGFGAGLVINDQVYHGNNYYAQEIAQLPLATKAFYGEHRLKNPYALELHCSGSGIEAKAKHYQIGNNAKDVFDQIETNEIAKEIVAQAKEVLTRIFATCAALNAPHYFFVGGSLALAQKDLVLQAFEEAKSLSDFNHFNGIKLVFDTMGDDSALYGLYYLINGK
ncbi:ROK family protein [Mycoplasma sp. NEAQ87857]|uniref:ROK family protein n=1 Tax=Mycoplasma sp. NEAQ87857 TaxID=2683967 RepID=UPI001318DA67|nr:ROK family protein [Mycoplasma sp. NEAQ87857]QGZ97826.1 ROK family protein [Mycoplasma sp. NEAQ87857]